ncbi:uncharacterized protein LOC141642967 [Silene latifolia]|uniref:uncharacterized protein LOC141642967 n=1 Tax=Silene latifolia TaxID=37657 RepID=UPI003D780417
MTLLDYSNLIINPFTDNHDDGNYGYGNNFPSEAELLCFDPLPPSLFDFNVVDFNPPPPLSIPPPPAPPLLNLDDYFFPPNNLHFDELIIPNDNYPLIEDYPPPIYLPSEDPYPFVQDFSGQFLPFPKKHKISYPENYYYNNNNNNHFGLDVCAGVGGGGGKVREVSAQSKAARERRRRITEKTQELGKLVPGGTKMNTAEMFQAAAKYVKFLQAQLGLLNTIQNLPEENIKEANLNNLPILGSLGVQEKLYTKEKCLFPMDFLPILEKHLDFEANPTISKDINDLIR